MDTMPKGWASEGKPIPPASPVNRFELWKEYERVAMHFNELIIKLRSQSLGGVAAFVTLAAVVTNSSAPTLRWGILTGAFGLLSVFWAAVWILDRCYYSRLLAGAVDALIALEQGEDPIKIELSTVIEYRVEHGKPKDEKNDRSCRMSAYVQDFYQLVFAGLVVVGSVAAVLWYRSF